MIPLHWRGLQDYSSCWESMRAWVDSSAPDQLWAVEHPPVYTQGQAGKPEHLLFAGDIPVVQTDRGGQITYHGPGQLILYPLIDIKAARIGVRDLITALEQSVVDVLAQRGIYASARKRAPGVYVGAAKISSLGLRVRKGRSFHGIALNVDMDLAPFDGINPCGYQSLPMTDARRLGITDLEAFKQAWPRHLMRHLIALGY
ncbi:lipoyl(octanoyl) transferase LipB [Litorivicinus lipolyticus]|uniref:lipoyl(octanoyl) transferase LipB n=1 Tax=Litorivicinus lipolyticus TaxID=418701 RepID=UPI003B5A92A4